MEPLQSLVPSVLAGLLKQGPLSSAKLEVAWRVAVGNALARATEVRLSAPGTVLVIPRDERWRGELQRSRRVILKRLQDLVGTDQVRRLDLQRPEGPG
jgi:predicted nucleic acid-binding Zn ribbon protein